MKKSKNRLIKKNKVILLVIFLCSTFSIAQEALHNFGNLKIHDNGAMGFYYNLINDGTTDDNLGTAGFFSDDIIHIMGAFRPVFYDMEIMVSNNLFLDVGVRVKNNTNYILGDVITPRNLIDVNLDYLDNTFYSGDDDLRKIDGYSALTNKQNFTFPIGDDDRLRPLTIDSSSLIPNAKSAYFFENPNNPLSIASNFDVTQKSDDVKSVSTYEFWYLDGSMPSSVTIGWDQHSNLNEYVENLEDLKVVGWHENSQQWQNLGGINISGDFTNGQLSSEVFMPDDYSVITFGSSLKTVVISLGNYILTANNDGVNDFLKIDGIENSESNQLDIYNRWGRLVYTKKDYQNSFTGKANVNMVVDTSDSLPDGVYFYIINLKDLGLKYQGYMYLIN